MPYRKVPLVRNEIYHICTKSIAKFKVFNSSRDYKRIMDEIIFYGMEKVSCKFSLFEKAKEKGELNRFNFDYSKKLVAIICYCIMPTHIHLILKELKQHGIAKFTGLILNSYSKYFNIKHNRKGPLWEDRFKNILVNNDVQFQHLTRYIHLNPVTAKFVNNPRNWKYSSYNEYIGLVKENEKLCNFKDYLDMDCRSYKKFVNDRIAYQRELELIKHLTLE